MTEANTLNVLNSDLEVGIVEVVDEVPARLTQRLPLQQDAVKEAEGEEQLPVGNGIGAAGELGFGHHLVQTLHVGFHSLKTKQCGQWD